MSIDSHERGDTPDAVSARRLGRDRPGNRLNGQYERSDQVALESAPGRAEAMVDPQEMRIEPTIEMRSGGEPTGKLNGSAHPAYPVAANSPEPLVALERKLAILAGAGIRAEAARKLNGHANPIIIRAPAKPAESLEEIEQRLARLGDEAPFLEGRRKLAVEAEVLPEPIEAHDPLRQRLEGIFIQSRRLLAPEAEIMGWVKRIPAESPDELQSKLDLLSRAGTLAEIERKLTWDATWWALVRQIPAETPEELERKLLLLGGAGTLAEIEDRLSLSRFDVELAALARQMPVNTLEESRSLVNLLGAAGSVAEIQERLSLDIDLVRAILAVPATASEELRHKLALLVNSGTLAEFERRVALDADQLDLLDRIASGSLEELNRKLELLAGAGTLADVERRLAWNANPWALVRHIPAQTPDELEQKLELLAAAGSLADVERKLGVGANPLRLDLPASVEELAGLERKLEQEIEAEPPANVESKPAPDARRVSLLSRIPAATPAELERKIDLLAGAGTLADLERKLSFDAGLISLIGQIPAATPDALKRKLELLSNSGSVGDVERRLRVASNVLDLVNRIPASDPADLRRKLQLLVERKLEPLSVFEENLLKLLRRIPAKDYEERERKIASLIPKRVRAVALAEEKERASDYGTFLVRLARRIPAATPPELEAKIYSLIPKRARTAMADQAQPRPRGAKSRFRMRERRGLLGSLRRRRDWIKTLTPSRAMAAYALYNLRTRDADEIVSPTNFVASMAAFSPFEDNLLRLLYQIPADRTGSLEEKIVSLMPRRARANAIAQAAQHSGDAGSYLVNLARHIAAANPRELEQKLSYLIPVERVPASGGRGSVCIVARKPIGNVTRGPRIAKALVDAGYRVVVVAAGRPVDELRNMCPKVEYLVAERRGFNHYVVARLRKRREERKTRRQAQEAAYRAALANGGWDAFLRRCSRGIFESRVWRAVLRHLRQAFVAAPLAVLLKKDSQRFAAVWRELAQDNAIGIRIKFVTLLNQWASSHVFAVDVERVTAGRCFDVVHVWDNYALLAGARLADRAGAKLVYDAVEIATDRLGQDLSHAEAIVEGWERRTEARIFRKANGMTGTGDALAGWYAKRYRMPKPLVLRNCRYYWPYQEHGQLRADIGATPETRILLWCGSAYPQQGIEVAIQAMAHLPAHVHLVVVADFFDAWKKYVTEELPAIAASVGAADRFHILPARGPNDLVPYISDGDIGFVLSIPVDHPNQYYNLPNKFFEYIMARMPVGTLAFPEVAGLVNKYEIGRVLDEHDSVKNAAIIQEMLEPKTYAVLKDNVMKAAQELCWENESRPYIELIDSLMPSRQKETALASRDNIQVPVGSAAATPGMPMRGSVYAQVGTE